MRRIASAAWRYATRDASLSAVAAVLMSAAALGTSWSSFQSTMWGQRQQDAAVIAGQARLSATSSEMRAAQIRMLDVALFSSWLNASRTGQRELADIYVARFREEFRPAFDAWMATRPFENPGAPPSPFVMKEYHPHLDDLTASAQKDAERAADAAAAASGHSSEYMLNTVIFAIVLFFSGTTHDASRHRTTRLIMLVIAIGAAAAGGVNLLRWPATGRTNPPPRAITR